MRDAGGHAANSKHFIPLTDVAKPSLQGRVKMYMQRLTDEEQREKQKQRTHKETERRMTNDNLGGMASADLQQKSQSMLGSLEGSSQRQKEPDFFDSRKGMRPPNTLDPIPSANGSRGERRSTKFLDQIIPAGNRKRSMSTYKPANA